VKVTLTDKSFESAPILRRLLLLIGLTLN